MFCAKPTAGVGWRSATSRWIVRGMPTMAKETEPKPPSMISLILSGLVALFLVWQIFGSTEAASPVIVTMRWVFLVLIVIFLGYSLVARKR